jgi:hypothetical protein
MGALMLETMRFVYKEFDTINGQSAVEFLKLLEKSYPNSKRITFKLHQS